MERPQQTAGGIAEPISAPSDANDCRVPLGAQRESSHALTFTSPSFVGIVLRKLHSPKDAIMLEGSNAHIMLRKGTILEIRHSAD